MTDLTDAELIEEYRLLEDSIEDHMQSRNALGVETCEHELATVQDEIIRRFIRMVEHKEQPPCPNES